MAGSSKDKKIKDKEIEIKKALATIDTYLGKSDWKVKENSNMGYSLQGLNNYISSESTKMYWLYKIYDKYIRDAHEKAEIHLHDLGSLSSYTYFGKETVIVKLNGKILNIGFDHLYEIVDEHEILLNKEDDAWVKRPMGLEVLDKDGWVKVRRLIRKKKNRPMQFIKSTNGRSVIVTDNHPMITECGERTAGSLEVGKDSLYTVDVERLLKDENLFSVNEIDLLKELKERNITHFGRFKIYFNCLPIEEVDLNTADIEGVLHTQGNSIKRILKLDEDFGFLIGFCLSDGMLCCDKSGNRTIHISQNDRDVLEKNGKQLLKKHGIISCINKNKSNMYTMLISNYFLKFVTKEIFNIKKGPYDKNLPLEHLKYSLDFNRGMIGGLIDGDGTGSGTQITLRLVSRTMLEQSALLLNLMGFYVRDRGLDDFDSVREYNESTKCWRPEVFDSWSPVLTKKETPIKDEYIYDITTESGTLVVNGMYNHNCCGWDLWDLLEQGLGGVPSKVESAPPSHFSSALGQINNFIFSVQGELAGAVAFSSFDTLVAPFIRKDKLTYVQIKQYMQELIFNLNVPTRTGFQTPFSNFSFDLTVSPNYSEMPVIIGGETDWYLDENDKVVKKEDGGIKPALYKYFQKEMDLINKAFCEIMMEGDYKGKIFTFPIPTYNITEDFDWDNPKIKPLFEMSSKYGICYFSNFINSDMKPEDARSMCCFRGDQKVNILDQGAFKIINFMDLPSDDFEVSNKFGDWVKAKKVEIPYAEHFYKISLKYGGEIICTEDHIHVLADGVEKFSKGLVVGDKLLEQNFAGDTIEKIEIIENNESLAYCVEITEEGEPPYFALSNGIITHNCRLRLDSRELRKKGGGLFGANPMTGSIGIVTLNLPRIGYSNKKDEKGYLKEVDRLLNLSRRSLLRKREVLEKMTENGLYPYTRHYLKKVKKSRGGYWANHFNTIGVLGMHESCLNMFGEGIETERGKEFAVNILNHIRERLAKFQEEDDCLYNLEATPGEGTTFRFAKKDREEFGKDIVISGAGRSYYSNSTHLPVDYDGDIFDVLKHQDDLQTLYSGGTVAHIYLGQKIQNTEVCKKLIRRIAENFRIPYFTLSPVFSICPEHGYVSGEHYSCPHEHNDSE